MYDIPGTRYFGVPGMLRALHSKTSTRPNDQRASHSNARYIHE